MTQIIGKGVNKSYACDILKDVDFTLEDSDHIGLVGRNGEGKTTLLRILGGMEQPTYGTIQRRRGLRVGYLPQDPPALTDKTLWTSMLSVFDDLRIMQEQMEQMAKELAGPSVSPALLKQFGTVQHNFESRGGYNYEVKIKTVLSGLGFSPDHYSHPLANLSGGQRTRALLGSLLLEEPDVLLLDEPTNHLDLEAVEWLEQWLDAFHGSLVIVSHDRYFLDRTVNKIWEISFTHLNAFGGNYSTYVQERAIQAVQQQRTYQNQRDTILRNEEFIRRNFAAQKHKLAHSREKMVAKLQAKAVEKPREHKDINLRLDPVQRSGEQIFKVRDAVIGWTADKPLLRAEELKVSRGQRLALVGGNGVGKTTLVRTLMGQIPPLEGTVQQGASIVWGYLPQTHDSLDGTLTVLETILRTDDKLNNEKARSLLGAFLFSNEDVFKRVSQLSGGERSRLVLATLAVKGANVLMLDEPTNHLDIASQEVLQEVLNQFDGTVVFVSHDRYLIDKLATHLWVIDGQEIIEITGNWQEFLRWRKGPTQVTMQAKKAKKEDTPHKKQFEVKKVEERQTQAKSRDDRKKRTTFQRRQETLEKEIHKLETHLKDLSDTISKASISEDFSKVHDLANEYQSGDSKLKILWAEWTELAEKLDQLGPENSSADR